MENIVEQESIEELKKRTEVIKKANIDAAAAAIQEVCEKYNVVLGTRTVIEGAHIDSQITIKSKV